MKSIALAWAGIWLCGGSAVAASPDAVSGDWAVGRTNVVRIGPCSGAPARLCGIIVATANGKDGRPLRDSENPDPALRNRPLVGLPLIFGFRAAGDGRWTGGKIYDPDDGKTYDAKLAPGPDGTLQVSGCVLFLCKAQTWRRPR
jgi:uncharacterized protein (DUF2147 family)